VIWTESFGSGNVSKIISVFALSGKYFVRIITASTPEGASETTKTQLTVSVPETVLMFADNEKPLTWTYSEESGSLLALSMCSFELNSTIDVVY
jgi:hypothetical protein